MALLLVVSWLWDESADTLNFTDSTYATFGDGGDMAIFHNGTNSHIDNATGILKIATNASGIAVTIGHTTSETTIAENLSINGLVKRIGFAYGGGSAIASGVLQTIKTNALFQYVDTESAASSDNLDTINGGYEGQIAIFLPGSGSRTVVFRHGTGNIYLNAGTNFSLDAADDRIMLYYQGAKWLEISRSSNG